MAEQDKLHFNLEVHTQGINREVAEIAQTILDDRAATLRERQLAWVCIKLCSALNRLVDDLETGTTTLTVYENSIRREQR